MPEVAVVKFTDNPTTVDSVVRRWPDFPKSLDLPDGRRLVSPVDASALGLEYVNPKTNVGFRFVEIIRVDWEKPGYTFDKTDETFVLGPTTLTATRVWTEWDQPTKDQTVAQIKEDQIEAYFESPSTRIIFELAKQINPALTQQQFITFVTNNWPDPVI